MNDYEEPEYLSTRIIEGPLDVHPTKCAVVVHYSVDAVVLSEDYQAMGADLKQCKKIINISNLTSAVNLPALARYIISQTSLIQPERIRELEQLLVYLMSRKQSKDIMAASSKEIQKQLEDSQREIEEVATMADTEEYLESLYESLPEKIRGTALILQLSRNPDNLQELCANESLFLALVRVLRDDWKKSIELTTNIVYIFFCFSIFSDFHHILLHHKIGSLCMTVAEHELKRHETLVEDLEAKKKNVWAKKFSKQEYEKSKKKFSRIVEKQESLLKVCIYLLLNLSESPVVEQKMRNKGIIKQLIRLISRDNQELLILVVSFLKKLSIYGDNKDDMAKEGILPKLLKLIPCDNDVLINVTLRLLMNLSFDPVLREEMTNLGFLPKLVALLNNDTHKVFVLFILYHISVDEKGRATFAYTECVPILMKFILGTEEPAEPEIMDLAINLSLTPINAQMMCRGPGLKLLLKRTLSSGEPLMMMKLIHNLSKHKGGFKSIFLDYIVPLSEIIINYKDEELLMEVLGIFSNIQIPNLDYNKVMTELKLLQPLLKLFKDCETKTDIILLLIMTMGTFANDIHCALTLVEAGLSQILIDTLKEMEYNDEIILQIANTFRILLLNSKTCDLIMKTDAPEYFIELMNDKHIQIRKLSSVVVTSMAMHSPEYGERVKTERFKLHNCQWLEMITGKSVFEDEYEDDEDYMDPYYLHMANELYSPEYFNDTFENPNIAPFGQNGRHTPLPTHPLYSSPVIMDYVEDGNLTLDELNFAYGDELGDLYGDHLPEDTIDYNDHPAFTIVQREMSDVFTARPPSRLQF